MSAFLSSFLFAVRSRFFSAAREGHVLGGFLLLNLIQTITKLCLCRESIFAGDISRQRRRKPSHVSAPEGEAMKTYAKAFAMILIGLTGASAQASQGTFDRILKVKGRVTLHILNGYGSVHVSTGSASMVRVSGHVTDTHPWGTKLAAQEDRIHQLAGNPPIQQSGNTIQVGAAQESLRTLRVDYEIEAPANTILDATTGMGDIVDEGVGDTARLVSKSGNISATGISGAFSIQSEQGDVVADGGASGDLVVRVGSGNLELHNMLGNLNAESDSGSIRLDGRPKADWHITSASGEVEYWTNRTPLILEATSSSGLIRVEGEMETIHRDKLHLTAKLHGGGPSVHIQTGSGDIRVHS